MHAILVHGYLASPEDNWFPWLRRELEARGFTVDAPQLPHPALPHREAWVNELKPLLEASDPASTILIGHSLGCVTIMYALESICPKEPFAGAVLAAGFGRYFIGTDQLVPWFNPPPDLALIKGCAKQWTCIHSHDDLLVPFAEGEWLAEQLGANFVPLNGLGHLMKHEGALELQSVLDAVLSQSGILDQ